MKTISESFKIIILKQNELGYHMPKILNPPTKIEEIEQVEKVLNINFNHELKELYSIANGIYNDYNTPSGLTGLIPIHNFLSLSDALYYYKNHIDLEDMFNNYDRNFKPNKKLFPFLEDGAGNCYWVDLNEGSDNKNKIFWTNTFGEDPDYLYNSLKNFMHTIAEAYDKNLFSLDQENYLNLNYSKFHEISSKNNNNLDYWKNS